MGRTTETASVLMPVLTVCGHVRFGAGGMTSLSPNKTLIVKFEVLVICTVENNEASKKKEEDLEKAARGSIFKLSHSVTGL